MKVCLECLPCLGRNAVDIAARITNDPALQKEIVAESLHMIADNPMEMPPPFLARNIIDIALRRTGGVCEDPYQTEKELSTRLAQQLVLELPRIPEYNPDDFESRLRIAIAGNILDFGVFSSLNWEVARESIRQLFAKPIDRAAARRLKARMDSAQRILYLLDNCGEAVFDRIFLEPYREKITLGVRGRAAFNDITRDDLAASGLEGYPVVTNGSGIPGTMLSCAPEEFREAFADADLVIAKGQGNFETLNETTRSCACLFVAKCPVVTRLIGAETNSIQIRTLNF